MPSLVVSYNNNDIYSGNDENITLSTTNKVMVDDVNIVIDDSGTDISDTTITEDDVMINKYAYLANGTLIEGTLEYGNNTQY